MAGRPLLGAILELRRNSCGLRAVVGACQKGGAQFLWLERQPLGTCQATAGSRRATTPRQAITTSQRAMSDRRLGRPRDGRSDPFGGGFGGDLGGFGGGGSGNPLEMMNSRMSQMDQMMSAMCGGSMLGGRGGSMLGGSMLGGGLLGQMDQMMSAGGSGLGGGSCCSSSYCCSSSSAGGRTVQYSQSSHGVRQPGQEWVSETQKNYRDSAGAEKIGVSRTIGNRGRSIVAERGADGTERRTDNVRATRTAAPSTATGRATRAPRRRAEPDGDRSLAGPAERPPFYGRPAPSATAPSRRARADADRRRRRGGARGPRALRAGAAADDRRGAVRPPASGPGPERRRVGYRHGGGGGADARPRSATRARRRAARGCTERPGTAGGVEGEFERARVACDLDE